MGRMRELTEEETTTTTTTTASLSEALLFTTMCIIGLPVEVHIKDGSIFSGIFHTASVDKGYGIALKKAKMIRKGTRNANVANVGLIETLVVLPGDLVQVVAEGVMLPADCAANCATCDDEGTVDSSRTYENGAVSSDEQRNQARQVGVAMPSEEEGYHHRSEALKETPKVNGSSTSLNGSYNKLNVHKENCEKTSFNHLANGSLSASDASPDVKQVNQLPDKEFTCTESVASEVSDSAKTDSDSSHKSLEVPAERALQNPLPTRTAKESKLNPSAKVFSPSFPNFRSTPPLVPTVQSVAYVPNNIPAVQVAGVQPEIGIRPIVPHSSWPVKFVPYVTSTTAMSADNGLQYNQPIAGHIVTRAQPMRHGAQYQPSQAVHPYVHPSPQNGIFGRPGQLVYVHPVTHDVIQAPATLSQAPHPLVTSHQIHVGVAKNEGVLAGPALPVSLTPPLMANGPQPFTMPSHIHQLTPPHFSSMRPVSYLGPNIPYSAKFP